MDISKTSRQNLGDDHPALKFPNFILAPFSDDQFFGFGDPPCNFTWSLCIVEIQRMKITQEYFEQALVSESQFCNYDNFGDGLIVWLNLFHLASTCLCFFRSHVF